MKTFTDTADRVWTVQLNVDAIRRVKALAGVNLLEAAEGKLLQTLAGDPVLLCDVLYAVLKPEVDAKSVTDADFGKALAGDAIDQATAALLEALVDFFPLGRRKVLGLALRKMREVEGKAIDVALRRLESPALAERIERELAAAETSGG